MARPSCSRTGDQQSLNSCERFCSKNRLNSLPRPRTVSRRRGKGREMGPGRPGDSCAERRATGTARRDDG
jgi:hypothetical protein